MMKRQLAAMVLGMVPGAALVVALAGLSYGYVLDAPSSEPLVPPAPPHIGLVGFDEPVHQPKAMPLQPLDPCYAVLVLQQGRFKCFPSGRLIPPVLRNQGRATVETIHGQRRILPCQRSPWKPSRQGRARKQSSVGPMNDDDIKRLRCGRHEQIDRLRVPKRPCHRIATFVKFGRDEVFARDGT